MRLFSGINSGTFKSRRMISARAPSLMVPILPSIFTALAPFMVANFITSSASMHLAFFSAPLYMRLANCISWNMFWVLLLPLPSVPRQMLRPASRNFLTGAKPLPSFILLRGLMAALTLCFLRILMSLSVALTRCAAIVGRSNSPEFAMNSTGVMPSLFAAISAISASLSEI